VSTVELSLAQLRPGSQRRRGSDNAQLMTQVPHAGLLDHRLLRRRGADRHQCGAGSPLDDRVRAVGRLVMAVCSQWRTRRWCSPRPSSSAMTRGIGRSFGRIGPTGGPGCHPVNLAVGLPLAGGSASTTATTPIQNTDGLDPDIRPGHLPASTVCPTSRHHGPHRPAGAPVRTRCPARRSPRRHRRRPRPLPQELIPMRGFASMPVDHGWAHRSSRQAPTP